mgnify:CR=1 FL=1
MNEPQDIYDNDIILYCERCKEKMFIARKGYGNPCNEVYCDNCLEEMAEENDQQKNDFTYPLPTTLH